MNNDDSNPVVPFLFALVAVVCLIAGLWSAYLGNSSKNWPTVDGKVIRTRISSGGGNGSEIKITYEFTVKGKRYLGGRVWSHVVTLPFMADQRFDKGQKVEVHYRQSNPQSCLLVPGVDGWHTALPLMALLFGGIAVFQFGKLMKALPGEPDKES
jgi:hypothetical protein